MLARGRRPGEQPHHGPTPEGSHTASSVSRGRARLSGTSKSACPKRYVFGPAFRPPLRLLRDRGGGAGAKRWTVTRAIDRAGPCPIPCSTPCLVLLVNLGIK